jgi:diguanylate cyclase (GGDEF)-like protein
MDILIAEDDNTSRMVLEKHLTKWAHRVVVTANGRQAWEVLQGADPPRIAILDWLMPEMDGMEVCQLLRQQRRENFTYVIMLTAKGSKEDVVSALEHGADDYLVKPCDVAELHARVNVGIRTVRLHEELVATNRKLEYLAATDYLTQVRNRRGVMEALGVELARTEREQKPLTLLMMDVDGFKEINDSLGHLAGDQVLVEVSRRLRSRCRPYDVIGRYGGDEFMVIVPDSPFDEIQELADRFRQAVEATPITADGNSLSLQLSVGATWLAADLAPKVDEIVRAVDALLYRAKEGGAGHTACAPYSPPE